MAKSVFAKDGDLRFAWVVVDTLCHLTRLELYPLIPKVT